LGMVMSNHWPGLELGLLFQFITWWFGSGLALSGGK